MSTTVDNRVVEMQFDNKDFESNVKTSMSTLEKLKQSLNLKGTSKGLESVQSAAKNFDMSGMSNGIGTVQTKFSALQVAGVTALATITNQAVVAGERMVKALSIGSVIDGFHEYETQMNAVQTILANTRKEGTDVATVNKYLDELNTYADKTIYNFTEMTRNIGTFTAAGVKLDTSVSAIQGIANLAAVSGSTSQQASTAMYQLSQAIASGTVKLMDWNSVVNAGMGGQVFQDALIRTSEHLKTGANAAIKAKGSFRESLSTGWLTVDVLTQTLDQFATAADTQEEYQAAVQKFVSQGYTKQQAKEMADMAKTAGDAATKVKTFTQLIDTLKEAMGSGWTKTWQLIIGDFEEAKSLWTSVSDVLSGAINNFSNARNDLLESALGKSFTDLKNKFTDIVKPIEQSVESVTKVTDSIKDLGGVVDDVILGKFGNGQKRFDALTKAGYNWCEVQNEVNKQLGCSKRYTEKQIAAQNKLLSAQQKTTSATKKATSASSKLTDEQKKQIIELANLSDEQLRQKGYTEEQIAAFDELRAIADKLGMSIEDFVNNIEDLNGRWILIDSFKNVAEAFLKVLESVGTAFKAVFEPLTSDDLFNGIAGFHKLTEAMIPSQETCEKLTRVFQGLFSVIQLVSTILGGAFKVALSVVGAVFEALGTTALDVFAVIGDGLTALNDWFQDSIFSKIVSAIAEVIPPAVEKIREFFSSLGETGQYASSFQTICEGVNAGLDLLYRGFTLTFGSSLNIAKSVLAIFGTNLAEVAVKLSEWIIAARDWIATNTPFVGCVNKIAQVIAKLIEVISQLVEKFFELEPVKNFIDGIKNAFDDFLGIFNSDFDGGFVESILKSIESLCDEAMEWLEQLGDSEHFGVDLVTGLANGIASGVGSVISAIANLASSIISTICGILGIHSPSTVMFEIGQNTIQGLINGISSMLSGIWDVLSGIGSGIVDFFKGIDLAEFGSKIQNGVSSIVSVVWTAVKSIAKGIADALGGIDWGVVTTLALSAGTFYILYNLVKVFDKMAGAFSNFTKPFAALGNVLDAFADKQKAEALKTKAEAIRVLATAIAILAASIWVLSTIDTGKAIVSLGIIALMMGLLIGLTAAMGKLAKASTGSLAEIVRIGAVVGALVGIATSLVLIAGAAKILGSMSETEFWRAAGIIAAVGVFIAALMFVSWETPGSAADLKGLGLVMMGIALSLVVLAAAAKIIGGLSDEEFIKAGVTLVVIGAFITGLMVFAKVCEAGVPQLKGVGVSMLGIAASILILAVAAKMLGTLSPEEIGLAIGALVVLGAFISALMFVSKLCGGAAVQVAGLGAAMLGITGSILIIAVAIKLLGSLSDGELERAMDAIGDIGILMFLLTAVATKFAGPIKGVAPTLLAMAAAVAILAGVAVVLGMVNVDNLIKGVAAVGALSVCVSLMVAVSHLAKDVKGTMIGIAVAIGILAASAAVLSFIEPSRLEGAVRAISVILALFALVEYSSQYVTGSFKTVLAMAAVLAVLSAALVGLSILPTESVIASAASLTVMLGALTGALVVLSKIGPIAPTATKAAFAMAGVVGILALVMGALTALNVAPSIETAASLSLLLLSLSVSLAIIAPLGPVAKAALPAIGLFLAFIVALGALMVALGALVTFIPQAQEFLDAGIPVLKSIGEGIGGFFGGIVNGFASEAMEILPTLGEKLSEFATNLQPFLTAMSSMPEDMPGKVALLSAAIVALTAAGLVSGVASLIPFLPSLGDMGTKLSEFATNLGPFIEAMNVLDPSAVTACGTLADMILKLTEASFIDGIAKFLGADTDFSSFGSKLSTLGTGFKDFMTAMEGVSVDGATEKANAVKALCEAASQIPTSGGLWSAIGGEIDIEGFATQLPKLGQGVKDFMASMEGVSVDGASEKANAVKALCDAASNIPTSGGLWNLVAGEKDAGKFGDQLGKLGEGVKDFADKTEGITAGALEPAKQAVQACIDIAKMVPEDTGIFEKIGNFFMGGGEDTSFVEKLGDLGEDIKNFSDKVVGVDATAVTNSKTALESLKGIADDINGWDTVTIDDAKTEFVGKLATVAASMREYANSVVGIDVGSITASVPGVRAIITIARMFANQEFEMNLSGIALFTNLILLGKGMSSYASSVSGVDFGAVSSSVSAGRQILSLINSISGVDTSGVASFVTAINMLGKAQVGKLVQAFSSASGKALSAGKNIITSLVKGLNSGKGSLNSAVSSMVTSMQKAFTSKASTFQSAGSQLADKLVNGIRSKKASAESAATSLVSGASTAIRGYYGSFYNAGSYVASGLASGIRSQLSSARSAANELAEAAEKATKAKLAINSPSKVFRKIGTSIPEGFAMGIGMLGGMVKRSSIGMAETAINSASIAMAMVSDIMDSDVDYDPVIRPVVDMTNVESNAAAINGLFSDSIAIGAGVNAGAISSMMRNRNQNGVGDDIVNAINKLRKDVAGIEAANYTVNGITYDDGSNVSDAVRTLVRATKVERRI